MISIVAKNTDDVYVKMGDMKPLQAGYVIEREASQYGHLVMRTAAIHQFEVMNLTFPKTNKCWTTENDVMVRLLRIDESVTMVISG